MAEVVENTENTENETPAVPQMSTVERAEMLLKQDATIREKIKSGATLDEAVDPSTRSSARWPTRAGADARGQARDDA